MPAAHPHGPRPAEAQAIGNGAAKHRQKPDQASEEAGQAARLFHAKIQCFVKIACQRRERRIVVGEEAAEHQVRGLANWLTGISRPQPETADLVPIAYNGVNPFGVNTFLNQEVEPEKRARQLDLIRDAGFKWFGGRKIRFHAG